MKAIIFARVSSKDQEAGQSMAAQVRRLTEYALRKNLTVENTYQVIESSSKDTRKQFGKIIDFVKKSKEAYAIITDTVDRLQRSFRETPMLDDLRRQEKLELHFLRENLVIDKNSNSAQMQQWDIGVLFASSYVRQLGDNVKRSQEQCFKNGQWAFLAPYGFLNRSLPSGKKTLEVNQELAPNVVKIFQLYAQGNQSYRSIAKTLYQENQATTSRGKPMCPRTVEMIIKNPFYMGMMLVKKQLSPHGYPTLVPERLFHHVQDLIAGRKKAPVKYAGKAILLRGLITCAYCRGTVCGDIKKEKYTYYGCHNAKRICTRRFVKEEVLVKTLLDKLRQVQLTDERINQVVEHLQDFESQRVEYEQHTLRTLNERHRLVQERISKLIDMHIDGKIDAQIYRVKLEEYKREKQDISLELNALGKDSTADIVTAREVLKLAQRIPQIYESSKLDEKRQLLGFFFSNLKLDHEKLDVELREPFKIVAATLHQQEWRE
ncbi:MAG: recombinase family protein [Candidatus Babeliaceae bacterium]|nr:recombinase family protein [Candidatus Babeliaceae bacterium]